MTGNDAKYTAVHLFEPQSEKPVVEIIEVEMFNTIVISKEEQEKLDQERKQKQEEKIMEQDENEVETLMSKVATPETIIRIIELTQKYKYHPLPTSQTRFNHNSL